MSGGHFAYKQYDITEMAEELDYLIRENKNEKLTVYGDTIGRHYSDETIEEFKYASAMLRKAAVYMQRIDWLVSCDDGEESFHERLAEDMLGHKK